jgi:hypothetical protein
MNGFWRFRPQNLVVAWWVDRNRWLWKFYLRQAPSSCRLAHIHRPGRFASKHRAVARSRRHADLPEQS